MSCAVLQRAAGRASTSVVCSSRSAEQSRAVPEATRSRRSVLLGLGAGLAGLAASAGAARAARPMLSDLTRPVASSMDANGDGLLDVDEIRGAMQRRAGISVPRETVVQGVMAPVDFDDDANITVDEFARGLSLDLDVDEAWMRVVERDGVTGVSQAELAAGLGDLGARGRKVVAVAFDMADKNRDGLLSAEEAAQAMRLVAAGVLGNVDDE